MKRYMSKFELNIDVYFETDDEYVAATTIRPILVNNELDDAARSDYQMFITDVFELFDYYELVTLDSHQSKSTPQTSYYYQLAHQSQVDAHDIPKIIDVRISDHVQYFSPARQRELAKQRRHRMEKLKQPKYKRFQKYLPIDIVVNKNTFKTYEDALTHVEQLIRGWLQSAGVDLKNYEEFGEW